MDNPDTFWSWPVVSRIPLATGRQRAEVVGCRNTERLAVWARRSVALSMEGGADGTSIVKQAPAVVGPGAGPGGSPYTRTWRNW
jgi:hypothetical protein